MSQSVRVNVCVCVCVREREREGERGRERESVCVCMRVLCARERACVRACVRGWDFFGTYSHRICARAQASREHDAHRVQAQDVHHERPVTAHRLRGRQRWGHVRKSTEDGGRGRVCCCCFFFLLLLFVVCCCFVGVCAVILFWRTSFVSCISHVCTYLHTRIEQRSRGLQSSSKRSKRHSNRCGTAPFVISVCAGVGGWMNH